MNPRFRCLVIDSDQEFLARMRRYFQGVASKWELAAFADSVEALFDARINRADLILIRSLSPQLEGLHMLSSVRSFDPEVAVVLLTDAPIAETALARGATACLDYERVWSELDAFCCGQM